MILYTIILKQVQVIYLLTRSSAKPDLPRSHAESCQRLLSCCSRVLRAPDAKLQRPYITEATDPGAAGQILQPANMHQKPIRIYAELFDHESANVHQKPIRIYADLSNMNQPTCIRNQSESMQKFSNMNQPTCTRNQSESMQNFSNMNDPTCTRNQWESMQNFSNVNPPTWIRNHAQTIRTLNK